MFELNQYEGTGIYILMKANIYTPFCIYVCSEEGYSCVEFGSESCSFISEIWAYKDIYLNTCYVNDRLIKQIMHFDR